MDDTKPKLLTISDLLHKSLPLSGTSSLTTSTDPNPPPQHSKSKQPQNPNPNPNPNPRTLTSLNYPTIIIGTLNLPTDPTTTTSTSSNSTNCNCFSFSDSSAKVCCAVLDFDVKMIGKPIRVLSWNFILVKCGATVTGLLEIITWNIDIQHTTRCSNVNINVNTVPLDLSYNVSCDEIFDTRSGVFGKLESVSPVSVVPCTVQKKDSETGAKNVSGFLVEVLVCKCKLCSSKVLLRRVLGCGGENSHSFDVGVVVYFFQLGSAWHPVMSELVGRVICVTGLKKKLVYIGKDDSCLMFITTEKSALSVPLLPPVHLPLERNERNEIKGNGELGAYSGIVTGFYIQGMLVELDEKVWLLINDQVPHSIRVGALVCLKNVHFVRPKFSWTRMLLLGTCVKTNITVKSFSPFESQCHISPQRQSTLGKFMESLAFSARFWLLLIVSSFKKIFAGRLSEKEILGSKHKEGLSQLYAKSYLPSCVFRPRHKLFMEFCNHKLCGCGNEPNYSDLKLVVPLSSFIAHCEISWVNFILRMQIGCKTMKKKFYWCEGKSYYSITKQIISSEDFGLILMGTLQISPSSGRLQMVDASGSVDVVIPDLPSDYGANNVYEVTNYTVVIEGIPEETDVSCMNESGLFSCKRILDHCTSNKGIKPSIYVHFYMRNTTCLNSCLRLPCKDWSDKLMGFEAGRFHLVLVTHKFPAIEKFHCNPINKPNSFVDAIILSWDLFLPGEHKDVEKLTEFSRKYVNENVGGSFRKYSSENQAQKRQKISLHGSTTITSSTLIDNLEEADSGSIDRSNNCSSPNRGHNAVHKTTELDFHREMPCIVLMRILNNQRSTRPGVLIRANGNILDDKVGKQSPRKILLEFNSECFRDYQLLQIGGYYIMKYGKEVGNGKGLCHVSGSKTLVTSQTPLWSVSLSCDDVISDDELLQKTLLNPTSVSTNLVPCESSPSGDLFFQKSSGQSIRTCHSDIILHLSNAAGNRLTLEMETMEDGLTKPMSISEETVSSFKFMMDASTSYHGPAYPDCRLPQGSLISLHGNIVSLHTFGSSPVNCKAHVNSKGVDDIQHIRGLPSSICIHISKGKRVVKLRGSVGKYAYPVGMGPGASATFHRVLVIRQDELMLTSVSFIVINSLKHVQKEYNGIFNQFGSDISRCKLLNRLSSSLLSELIQSSKSCTMRFRCRVVAIHVLVLENENFDLESSELRMQSRAPVINIPYAGFIIDDGSLPCCCWASSERAATLLRLDVETVIKPISSDSWRLHRSNVDKSSRTASHHLQQILKKHRKVTVKNYGGVFDSSYQDLTFAVDSNNVFNRTDENFLKLIISNACCGSVLNVVGTIMDSNAIGQLVDMSGMHMTMDTMQHVWATEVQYADHQTEAADLIEELMKQ